MKKNEVAHYPEIMSFIESQLLSNFRSAGIDDISIFWKSGELTSKIKELIYEYITSTIHNNVNIIEIMLIVIIKINLNFF